MFLDQFGRDSNEGEVSLGVLAHQLRLHTLLVVERDHELPGFSGDMKVGDDVPLIVDEETTAHRGPLLPFPPIEGFGDWLDVDQGRQCAFLDLEDGLLQIGISRRGGSREQDKHWERDGEEEGERSKHSVEHGLPA